MRLLHIAGHYCCFEDKVPETTRTSLSGKGLGFIFKRVIDTLAKCALVWLLLLGVTSILLVGCSNTSERQTKTPRHSKITDSEKPKVVKQRVVPEESLEKAGIDDPASVRMVIYQRSGYDRSKPELVWGNHCMALAPFTFSPVTITSRSRIAALCSVIDMTERTKDSNVPRHDRLAFVMRDNRVVVFGVSKAVSGKPVFVTPTHSSAALTELLLKVAHYAPRPSVLRNLQISRITYPYMKDKASLQESRSDKWRTAARASQELIGYFDPMTLKGNMRYSDMDIANFFYELGQPNILEIKLKHRVSVSAVVLPAHLNVPNSRLDKKENNWSVETRDTSGKQDTAKVSITIVDDKGELATVPISQIEVKDFGWPPATYDASGKLETIEFNVIRVYDEGKGVVRFALLDSGDTKGLFSDPVNVGEASVSRVVDCLGAEQ